MSDCTYQCQCEMQVSQETDNMIGAYGSWCLDRLARGSSAFGPSPNDLEKLKEKKKIRPSLTSSHLCTKRMELEPEMTYRHKEVETIFINEMNTDWGESINIGGQYGLHNQNTSSTLVIFHKMWDGH